jgi:hypothetical protein
MAVELESFISGDRFRYIATRIAKSYQKKMAEQLEDEELQQFFSKLKSLRVMALISDMFNGISLMIDESFCGRILCGNFINNSSGLRSFLSFLNMVKSNIKSITV